MQSLKILLTGSTGLLGSAITRLFGSSHEFLTVGRSAPDGRRVHPHLFFDFASREDFDPGPLGIDAVLHLAQSKSHREFPEKANETFYINTRSTIGILEYCRKNNVRTFLAASTGGVYRPGSSPFTERDQLRDPLDQDLYFASKMAAEGLCGAYSGLLNVIVARYFFIFGKGQDSGQLFPRLAKSVINGQPIQIDQSGGLHFNPIHVDDAARATMSLLTSSAHGIFNVAGDTPLRLQEFVIHISRALGVKPNFSTAETALELVADTTKLRRVFLDPMRDLYQSVVESLTQ